MDEMSRSKIRTLFEELGVAWATFFYTGYSPKAPGTAGSLAALPLAWLTWQLPRPMAWLAVAAVFFSGAEAARAVIRRTRQSDHQSIVIDEVVGILIATSVAAQIWWHYLLAFLLFRIFDIWKPWPIRYIDKRWHSAYGTMLDDVLAALAASAVLFFVLR
jgi:phosphatidylglycerophosphatase A